MLSANASLSEFIDQIADRPYDDIILLADREATAAQRQYYKQRTTGHPNGEMKTYALLLKDFMVYMRHGVASRALRSADGDLLAKLPRS
ncbi:MAG: hypothetical protein P8010_25790 [Desulfosarcinaceae bacterium]|jgi:hypothetical protein